MAGRGGEAVDVERLLDGDGHAVERPEPSVLPLALRAGPIGPARRLHRAVAIDNHQSVEWAVETRNSLQVHFGRLDRAQPAVSYGACKARRGVKTRVRACLPCALSSLAASQTAGYRAGGLLGDAMSLGSKTLFVTGASRGIGLAIALRAARDGANVAIAAKTKSPHPTLEGTIYTAAEEIEKAGGQALPLVVDVRDEAAVKGAIDQTAARFGSLDIVVNNASAISLTPATQTDMKRFDLMHQINARGTFMVSKHAIAHLEKAANPHILMISPPLDMAEKWFAPYTGYTMAQVG